MAHFDYSYSILDLDSQTKEFGHLLRCYFKPSTFLKTATITSNQILEKEMTKTYDLINFYINF